MARASNSSSESVMSFRGAAPAISDISKTNRTGREDDVRQGGAYFPLDGGSQILERLVHKGTEDSISPCARTVDQYIVSKIHAAVN
jgi:hypothetical protein